MNRDRNLLYILSGLFLGILLLVLFVPNVAWQRPMLAVFLSCFALIVFLGIKKRSLLSIHKREIAILVLMTACVYTTIYYLSGLYFGFYPSIYRITSETLLMELIPTIVLIVASEVIRGVFLWQRRRGVDIMSFVSLVALDVVLGGYMGDVDAFYGFVDFYALSLFPAVTENLLYHYLSRRYGILPNIAYRSISAFCPYLIPYTPAIPNSWLAFARLLAPLLVYLFLFILYEKKKYAVSEKKRGRHTVSSAVCLLVMAALVVLVSCRYRYGVIVVGSESMTGAANKGDALLYERYEGQLIREGEIVIFEKDGRKIIHRVVDIRCTNGELRYYTKGDANDSMDTGYVTEEMLIGIADVRICYIGYPTIWLREMFISLDSQK